MTEPAAPDEDTMVHVAVEDLAGRLPSVARPNIEASVRRWVRHWQERARVQTFVGVIAERDARRELESDIATGRALRPDAIAVTG
jgi:hypothetical protein